LTLKKKKLGKKKELVNSNVIYASIITAKARIKLHKAMLSVVNGGGRLLYTDTDSIFAEYTRVVDNERHGEVF
jgi:DNA polymerase elongation subunit (family B)